MENSDGYFSHHLIGRRAHTRLGVEGHVENQPPAIDGSWKKVLFGFFFCGLVKSCSLSFILSLVLFFVPVLFFPVSVYVLACRHLNI